MPLARFKTERPTVTRERAAVAGALLVFALHGPAAASPQDGETVATVATVIASGDTGAMVDWATRFEHGEGVERDYAAAVDLYCAAARKGDNPLAEYQLGWLYANGRGVAADDGIAAAWFLKAAQSNDTHAERMLARLGGTATATEARCVRPDNTEAMPPVHSVPNPSPQLVAQWVKSLSPHYGLDPALVLAVIKTESNFNPRALSPKNAQGLMQLIPATARRFGVEDVWDPVENIKGGMAYLRWLHDHFEGNLTYAVAAYNAGENAVKRYGGIPPYAETQHYVKKVTRLLGHSAQSAEVARNAAGEAS